MAADRARRAQRLATRLRNPDARFKDHIDAVVWGSHLRQRSWTVADLDAVDAERVEALYRERYANAADFTFAVVGDVKPKALRPLVERWVGSLPGDPSARETWDVSTAPTPAPGPQRSVLRAGTEPKATVLLQWRIEGVDVDRRSRHHADLLGRILDQRLRLKLREELGGTYGVDVGLWLASLPTHEANVRIHFVCDPERAAEPRGGPRRARPAARHAPHRRRARRRRALRSRPRAPRPGELELRQLAVRLQRAGWDLDDIHTRERSDDALFAEDSPERLHALAQRILDDSAAFEIVRLPEDPAEAEGQRRRRMGADLPAERPRRLRVSGSRHPLLDRYGPPPSHRSWAHGFLRQDEGGRERDGRRGAGPVRVNGAPSRAGGLSVTIDAHAKGECKIDKVYLKVRCARGRRPGPRPRGRRQRQPRPSAPGRSPADPRGLGALRAEAGAAASWEAQVAFPSGALPSVHGQLVRVVWEMQAGLDMWGNDPDSVDPHPGGLSQPAAAAWGAEAPAPALRPPSAPGAAAPPARPRRTGRRGRRWPP